jgi:hypothetical protein
MSDEWRVVGYFKHYGSLRMAKKQVKQASSEAEFQVDYRLRVKEKARK